MGDERTWTVWACPGCGLQYAHACHGQPVVPASVLEERDRTIERLQSEVKFLCGRVETLAGDSDQFKRLLAQRGKDAAEAEAEAEVLRSQLTEARAACHAAHEFAGNVIRYATGPVKTELWEDDSPLIEQAWEVVKICKPHDGLVPAPQDREPAT